jgi:hypothetical protein
MRAMGPYRSFCARAGVVDQQDDPDLQCDAGGDDAIAEQWPTAVRIPVENTNARASPVSVEVFTRRRQRRQVTCPGGTRLPESNHLMRDVIVGNMTEETLRISQTDPAGDRRRPIG